MAGVASGLDIRVERRQSYTGATGLEPATSGVTVLFGGGQGGSEAVSREDSSGSRERYGVSVGRSWST